MYSNNNLPLGNVLIGKAIVIDITKNNYKLSESPFSNGDLKYYNIIPIADNPKEVYTLIVMNHYYEEVGRYTDNMSGFREHYNVTLINTKTLGYVSQDFEGSMPPNPKTGSGPAYGSSPESDVREYLKGLEKISENEYMTQLSIYL